MLANRMMSRAGYHVVSDLPYGADPRQKLDLYVPDHSHRLPVLLFFYGGGWQGGTKSLYLAFGQAFAGRAFWSPWPITGFIRKCAIPLSSRTAPRLSPMSVHHAARYGGDPGRLFHRRPFGGRL